MFNFLDAYWMRELIYIESILPKKIWLKSMVIEEEIIDHYIRDSAYRQEEDDDSSINASYDIEPRKLLDILQMLCIQAKQVLEYEFRLEIKLKQLLRIKKESFFFICLTRINNQFFLMY